MISDKKLVCRKIMAMHTPFFVWSRVLTSYLRITLVIILFYIGYALPILIASNFNIFDPQYKLWKDIFIYVIPLITYFFVFAVNNVTNRIFDIFPDEYQKYKQKSDETVANNKESTDNEFVLGILTKPGYDKFKSLFQLLTSLLFDIFWMIVFIIFFLVYTYGNWWNIHGFYYYYSNSPANFYTTISGFTIFIFSFVIGSLGGSTFGFVISFTFSVFLLPWLKSLPIGEKNLRQKEDDDIYNITTFNKNDKKDTKNNGRGSLTYSRLYEKVKSLTGIIFIIFVQMLLLLMLATITIILTQLIDANKIDYIAIFQMLVLDCIVLGTFFCNIWSVQRLLKRLKGKIIANLNNKYTELVNEYFDSNQPTSEKASIINNQLSTIIQIIEREESLPAGLIDSTVIVGLLIPIVAPIVPIIVDYIQKLIH